MGLSPAALERTPWDDSEPSSAPPTILVDVGPEVRIRVAKCEHDRVLPLAHDRFEGRRLAGEARTHAHAIFSREDQADVV